MKNRAGSIASSDANHERPGALDVHKASVTACVRIWEGRKLTEQIAELQTTVAGLLALGDWLAALGVRQVVMEATGVYWKPVWAVLEDSFELMLVNARHVKQCQEVECRREYGDPDSAVGEDAALAAFVASKPGRMPSPEQVELEAAVAENSRLSEALKELAVELTLHRGSARAFRPGPRARER